jgi:hypothetical protein
MRVHQYVYFALRSDTVSAERIGQQVGLAADEVMVQGSKQPDVPIPRAHAWKIVCRDPALFLHEQVSAVVERLEPHADRIAALTAGGDAAEISACLQIVREYQPEGDDEEPAEPNLLGWGLEPATVAFLHRTGASVDVDEYHC